MRMSTTARAGVVAGAAAAALALTGIVGASVASAADSTPSPTASSSATDTTARQHAPEEALTGDTAAKVTSIVEAKYPGATIERMEKDSDGTSVYEAHITKADGTHVTVMLDAAFAITGEDTGHQGHGPRGMGHGHGHGPGDDAATAAPRATTG